MSDNGHGRTLVSEFERLTASERRRHAQLLAAQRADQGDHHAITLKMENIKAASGEWNPAWRLLSRRLPEMLERMAERAPQLEAATAGVENAER